MENSVQIEQMVEIEQIEQIVKKKRTRRTKNSIKEDELTTDACANANANASASADDTPTESEIKIPKKRGRKPKGGQIISTTTVIQHYTTHEPNIILHLKCGVSDLNHNKFLSSTDYDPNVSVVETFQFENNKSSDLGFCIINNDNHNPSEFLSSYDTNDNNNSIENNNNNNNNNNPPQLSMKEAKPNTEHTSTVDNQQIWNKLKELRKLLHNNNISDKKSACFWCTYEFDNPPILIPKHELNSIYHCYGCFCSPECATAHLFKESIDTATMFERYHLLNHIYCKIYDYNKNIKPAPNPYYTLNKYYGNLSIQEYRKLLKNERLLMVVDKPLSRVLPELHEENDDYMTSSSNILTSNKFKIRRKTKQNKNEILEDTFNMKS
jgi:hypothetical protein